MASYLKPSGILFFLCLSFIHGFLLDTNKGQQTATNQAYLTVSDFFDEKTKLQDRVTDLRDDVDKKMTLLANQLQQLIASSGGNGLNICQNETQRFDQLEEKYEQLFKNYSSLEQKYHEVLNNNAKLGDEFAILETKMQNNSLSIDRNSDRVAITACISSITDQEADWNFDDVRTRTGINNISSLSAGRFICESDGLYLVSAFIMSNSTASHFYIFKNYYIIARIYIASNNDGKWDIGTGVGEWYSGTGVVAVELAVNDTVWVSPGKKMYAFSLKSSCLTIVKIK